MRKTLVSVIAICALLPVAVIGHPQSESTDRHKRWSTALEVLLQRLEDGQALQEADLAPLDMLRAAFVSELVDNAVRLGSVDKLRVYGNARGERMALLAKV